MRQRTHHREGTARAEDAAHVAHALLARARLGGRSELVLEGKVADVDGAPGHRREAIGDVRRGTHHGTEVAHLPVLVGLEGQAQRAPQHRRNPLLGEQLPRHVLWRVVEHLPSF
ncbi:MAG: hypothetical protein ACK559_29010, partial [bacterium]